MSIVKQLFYDLHLVLHVLCFNMFLQSNFFGALIISFTLDFLFDIFKYTLTSVFWVQICTTFVSLPCVIFSKVFTCIGMFLCNLFLCRFYYCRFHEWAPCDTLFHTCTRHFGNFYTSQTLRVLSKE